MEITEKLLENIFKRSTEYCIAKFGNQPDEFLLENGFLCAIYREYCCGETTEKREIISVSCLSEDLEKVYDERIKKEAEERARKQAKLLEMKKLKEKQELLNRKLLYEKLKKEFEG